MWPVTVVAVGEGIDEGLPLVDLVRQVSRQDRSDDFEVCVWLFLSLLANGCWHVGLPLREHVLEACFNELVVGPFGPACRVSGLTWLERTPRLFRCCWISHLPQRRMIAMPLKRHVDGGDGRGGAPGATPSWTIRH